MIIAGYPPTAWRFGTSIRCGACSGRRETTFEFQAVLEDISARKQSEQALRASEESYRSLIANIPDVVWTADANRSLLYVSDNIAKVLGYTADELVQGAGGAVAGPHSSR